MSDSLSDLTEDQQRRVAAVLAKQLDENTFVIPWQWLARCVGLYVVLPLLLASHVFFLLANMGSGVELNLLWVRDVYPKHLLLLVAFAYGAVAASTVFYLRQRGLLDARASLQREVRDLRDRLVGRDRELERLRYAASKVVVPYRLDSLVDKGLTEFMDFAAQPRVRNPLGS